MPYIAGSGGDLNYRVQIAPLGGGTSALNVVDTSTNSQSFTAQTHQFQNPAPGTYVISFSAVSGFGSYNDNTALITDVTILSSP